MGETENWRNDRSISIKKVYTKEFAYLPVFLSDKTKIWWQDYYTVKQYLFNDESVDPFRRENANPKLISRDEYLFRKLAGTLNDT